ncbi:MAG: T9SS type A sorting domain-containing protein [Bacteroidales bacterium]|nr:T9SS type A sorting domain-containing protein [Bacteroidales bacterium]MCF8455496.1 T9SS type A sorting domain-containing protein [Bacteroidales bacterium]
MKNLLLILSICIGISVSAQNMKRDIIPIEQLKEAADRFADQRWGNVDAAEPIPYYDPSGNVIAYGFNYAIGKEFPKEGRPTNLGENELDNESMSKNQRWGVNEYAHCIFGTSLDRTSLVRFIAAMSDEYAFYDEIREMAASSFTGKSTPVLDKIYFQTPMLKYYKFDSGNESVYVRIFPPARVLSPAEFQVEYVDNFDINKVIPMSIKENWDYFLTENQTKNVQVATYIPYQEECVPFLDWHYGCSPTAGGMLLDYWDNYSDYSSNDYGNLTKHHFYESGNGGPDYNITTSQEACAIQMGTNYSTGSTGSNAIGPGVVDAANSAMCGSYNFSQTTTFYSFGTSTAKWNQQIGEINANRPWHCGVDNHSMTAIGYEVIGSDNFMIVHNTWDPPNDWWNYTLNYRISEIYPGGAYGSHIEILTPQGDPAYNHNGNGEILYSGNVYEITWSYDTYSGAYCKLLYSTNAGSTFTTIIANTPCDGSYLWTIPSGLSSSQGRVKIEMYSSGGTLIASDGSWGNLKFFTGGSIVTLSDDVAVNTTTDPTYYQINNTNSKWGAVGIRSADNWSIKMYTSNTFATEAIASAYTVDNDFILFDQHHLSNTTRGVQCYQFSGTATARTEYEGGTESLTLGVSQTHSWTANDVVEVWDIYLAAGTYKFTMNYNSGSANLDMALFSSYGGGPYYLNRNDYLARSTNSGTANETFFVTIPGGDYYGFLIWSNDANSASVTINSETTVAGLWEGDVSSNWNTAGNWNDNTVPTATTDVVIPSGTTYSPYVYVANASAKNVTIESGATLHIGAYDLTVEENVVVNGTIRMYDDNADLFCNDIIWESGSQANMVANGEFRVSGDWNFEFGANVHMTNGNVWFTGATTAYIRSYEADCYFNKIYAAKTGGAYIGVSALSGEDLVINGDLYIYSYSAFNIYSSEKVIFNSSFNNVGGHFLANFGTVEFAGNPTITLKPNVGDYFNNLRINVGTGNSLGLGNTYSDSLVVKGDVFIETGNFDCNDLTITVGEDWTNQSGTFGFYEQVGKVIFNGSSGYQYCYGETFYDFQHNSGGSNVLFYGLTNITNNYYCYGNAFAFHDVNIDNMFLGLAGNFNAYYSGVEVNIDDLDMGSSVLGLYLYGTIEAYNGSIYVGDLAENGLYGTFKVTGPYGLLDITQDASGYIDLNGTINITNGTMNVHGGAIDSYWPYYANASITMSNGVLDFIDRSIYINNSSYTLTTNITGGTIRTPNSFSVYDEWAPAGGTLEFYGSNATSFLNMGYQGSALYNLHVNKTSGMVDCNTNTVRISNDVLIDGGILAAPSDTLYVGGDWTNNGNTYNFYEYDDVVCFYGPNTSNIYTDEDFDELVIDKTYANFDGVVQATGKSVHCLQGSLHVIDGTYEMDPSSIMTIDNDLIIENGAGFNANDLYTEVFLGGNLTDYNTIITTVIGLSEMNLSNDFTFNGTGDQALNLSSTEVEFGNLIVDKTYQSNLNIYDGFRVTGDLTITSGDWIDVGTGQNYYLEGDLTVAASGAWFAYDATVHFEGSSTQYLEEVGYSGYFGDVVINSTSLSGGVNLNSDLIILNNHDLTINYGHLWADGNLIRVIGDVIINSSGEFNMDDDSELNIGSSGHLNINSGGVFEAIGSEGHLAVLESNDANYWQFNCFSGGTVSAEWASFSGVDTWGVYIWTGGFVNTSHSFNHCTFLPGQSGGALLDVENTQNFTINYANFPSQGVSTYNVRKGTSAGTVTMMNYMGSFAGEAFDYDPNNNVVWNTNLSVSGVTTNVSCNGGSNGAIDITVTGGTPGYTYLWNNGATQGDRSNLTAGTYTLTTTDSYGLQVTNSFTVTQPAVYNVSGLTSDVSCYGGNDGGINISLWGGTPPDTYLWSNGSTLGDQFNLPSGTYSLTCTDANGCVVTNSWTITQPSAIAKSFVKTNVSCFGGSNGAINLTVSGGTTPYTYLWNDGPTTQDRTNLSAGVYTVTITDYNGCTSSGTQTITQPSTYVVVGFTSVNVSCFLGSNGSIDMNVTGGTTPYTYFWNGGVTTQDRTNLTAGTYSVTVTDANGCTATGSRTITQPSVLTQAYTKTNVTCYGGSDGTINLTVGGGTSPYFYLWNDGATTQDRANIIAGVYWVTITDANGCTGTGTQTISQPTGISITGTVTNVTLAGGSDGSIAASASGGTPPYSYSWGGGQTTPTITGLMAGTNVLTVMDSNGCGNSQSFTVLDGTVGSMSLSGIVTDASCYGSNDGAIDMTINGGSNPYTVLWSNGSAAIDQNNLGAGVYTVTVTDFYSQVAYASFTVNQPAQIVIVGSYTNASCYGGNDGSLSASVSGGTAPYYYNWSNGGTGNSISGLTMGAYSLTVTDANGCSDNDTYFVSQPASAVYITENINHVTVAGGNDGWISTYALGGTSPYTYAWSTGSNAQNIYNLIAGTYTLTVTDANGCTEIESYVVNDGSAPTLYVTAFTADVTCYGGNNGEINSTVSGGVPPYSYLWSNGSVSADPAGLIAGTYSVTVTDAMGSTATGSWTINQPTLLTVTNTVVSTSCFGGNDGEVYVYPTGAISPYSYNWSNGYTGQYLIGVVAGTYSVTITDANGCLYMNSYVVSEPPALLITYTKTDVSTAGGADGAIDLTVSGGNPGYTYLWSTGALTQDISGLMAGYYDVTVSDSNGCTAYETIEITEPGGLDVQNINLVAGWSIISTYIIPVQPLIDSIFAPVVTITAIVKNGAGAVYWPAFGVNSIGNAVLGQGYQVKMNASAMLPVTGTAVVPELTPITIPAGWSIIAYLRQVPGDAVAMMSPIVSNIAIMKNGGGAVYWPAFGVNGIGNMLPGQGYQIKLNATSTLTYPANSVPSKLNVEPMQPMFYQQPAATGNNMTIGFPTSAFLNLPMIGDEVGVFNSQGLLVGSAIFDGSNLAIPIWGDDDLTPETDGLTYAEGFELRTWNGELEQGITIESWTEGDGLYERDAIQIANKVSFTNMDAMAYSLDQNVPNPYGATTRIAFYLPETSNISLTIYDVLGNVMDVAAEGEFQAGQHSIELDGSQYAMGTYFYRLIANDFVCTKQMEVGR